MAKDFERTTSDRTGSDLHNLIRTFHGNAPELDACPGDSCPYKNCEICPAAKGGKLMPSDSYRNSARGGYYSSCVCRDKNGKIVGYMKPGE